MKIALSKQCSCFKDFKSFLTSEINRAKESKRRSVAAILCCFYGFFYILSWSLLFRFNVLILVFTTLGAGILMIFFTYFLKKNRYPWFPVWDMNEATDFTVRWLLLGALSALPLLFPLLFVYLF